MRFMARHPKTFQQSFPSLSRLKKFRIFIFACFFVLLSIYLFRRRIFQYCFPLRRIIMSAYNCRGIFVGICTVSADKNGKVRLRKTVKKDHTLKAEYEPFGGPILDVSWSPDSQRVCVFGQGPERFGHIFMADSGTSLEEISGQLKSINSCDSKPIRNYRIIVRDEDNSIGIFEGQPLKSKRKQIEPNFLTEEGSCKTNVMFFYLLIKPLFDSIDYIGNGMSSSLVIEKVELQTALSWLSTLGGAFSALGDLSLNYAKEAGTVSLKQLQIAMKLEDPLIQSRCRIWMAISQIQKGRLKLAKKMVLHEYKYARSLPEGTDPKLIRMCQGVWAKLQYAWKLDNMSKKKHQTNSIGDNNRPQLLD